MEMELWNDLDGVTDGYVGGAGWLGTLRRMGKRDATQPGLSFNDWITTLDGLLCLSTR
jgi:hypothetical protein